MDQTPEAWLWFGADEGGGFGRFLRALKPSKAHRGIQDVWSDEHLVGLRIDHDLGQATFLVGPHDEQGVTLSIEKCRELLTEVQDTYLGR